MQVIYMICNYNYLKIIDDYYIYIKYKMHLRKKFVVISSTAVALVVLVVDIAIVLGISSSNNINIITEIANIILVAEVDV